MISLDKRMSLLFLTSNVWDVFLEHFVRGLSENLVDKVWKETLKSAESPFSEIRQTYFDPYETYTEIHWRNIQTWQKTYTGIFFSSYGIDDLVYGFKRLYLIDTQKGTAIAIIVHILKLNTE